jgi:RNA polymerase sigma-70 factor (ECF subfamily)
MDDSSEFLADRLRAGDPDSSQAVFDRYIGRLLALVRPRISRQLGQRIDPEDVAQSAFRSFFRRAGQDELELGRGAPLWRLISAIAVKKLLKQAEHHSADKRSVKREAPPGPPAEDDWLAKSVMGREPDPAQAAAVADELESRLSGLDPLARRIVNLRLQNHSHEEIAAEVQRSERTVRRILAHLQTQWQNHID